MKSAEIAAFFKEPLQGKTPLWKVVWLYGLGSSILYGAIELLLDPENQMVMRLYTLGGIIISVYVCVAVYRCAANTRWPAFAQITRILAIISLLLLPVFVYLDRSGALSLDALTGE
jgi:hypothetical protein